jgi:hypothetical protein
MGPKNEDMTFLVGPSKDIYDLGHVVTSYQLWTRLNMMVGRNHT